MPGSPETASPLPELNRRESTPAAGAEGKKSSAPPPHPDARDPSPDGPDEGAEVLRLALRAAGAGAWSYDPATRAVEWGEGYRELIGLDRSERPGTPEEWLSIVHPEDRERVRESFAGAIATGGECSVEYRLDHPKRGPRWLMATGKVTPSPRKDGGGGPGKLVGIVLDVTERKRAEQDRRESDRRDRTRAKEIEALMDAVPAIVWIARDPDCRTITGNRAATELLRATRGANVSLSAPERERPTNFRAMRHGVEIPADQLPIQVAARTGMEVRGFEEDIAFDDGTVRRLYGNASPLFDDGGNVRGAVAAFVDVTELKAAEEALREADRRKDEFLATLAHELRNPVAAIDSVVELNRRSGRGFEPDGDWAREVLERQVKQLARLIDDLLDVARISRGKLQLRLERIDAAVVIARAAGAVRPIMEQYRHQVTVETGGQPLPLDVDPTRLEQVVVNLLNNAAKYTDPGGAIAVEAGREGAQVVIAVSDNGLGLTREARARIFELFTQFNTSPARARGGLGIGLKLVRALSEAQGGAVTVESAGPGLGSKFTVRLPLAEGPSPGPGPGAAEPASSTRSKRAPAFLMTPDPDADPSKPDGYILVVDDNVDAARGLSRLLRAYGLEVEVVHDGPSALAAAAARAPAVVLLDIGLPGMDGHEVARRLRGDLNQADARIIAVSGYGQDHDRAGSHSAGIDHHVVKPVDLDTLLALILKKDAPPPE